MQQLTLNCRGRLLTLDRPLVMGILNLTPDSFYPGSRFDSTELLRHAEKMINDGADILDVGGQSSRPRSSRIPANEEWMRVADSIDQLHRHFPDTVISIDTFYATVARVAVEAGAAMINDISAGNEDEEMLTVAGKMNVPYICMHMKGTPQTMQQSPYYDHVVQEIIDFFIQKIQDCHAAGIKDMIIDPGFGFGKTIAHNFKILKELNTFKILGKPLMCGLSRKSTIYKTLGVPVEEAMNGTTVMNTIALTKGADILRVHDVKEAVEAVKLYTAYSK